MDTHLYEQTKLAFEQEMRQVKLEMLAHYLRCNEVEVIASATDAYTVSIQTEIDSQNIDSLREIIISTMEALNFTVFLYGSNAYTIQGFFYSPPDGIYAGLPPIYLKTEPKPAK